MANSVVFSRLIEEYGSQEEEEEGEVIDERRKRQKAKAAGSDESTEEAGPKRASDPLMQLEERNTGAVTWSIYKDYLRFAGGVSWAPFIILFLTLTQAAQGAVLFIFKIKGMPLIPSFSVGNNLFLGFWTEQNIPGFHQGDYMAIYASLGKFGSDI